MALQVNIHEAKTHFSKLLAWVKEGEEVIIAKAGVPVARLVPVTQKQGIRVAGSAKGKITVAPDFDAALPEDILEAFELMKVLHDTHVFLWWITDDPRLTERAREIISDGENTLFFSAASGWEIAIKAKLGKLSVPDDLEGFIMEQLAQNDITPLPVRLSHVLHVYNLPAHHRDPFDRLLVAQAQVENLPILTGDAAIMQYPVQIIW